MDAIEVAGDILIGAEVGAVAGAGIAWLLLRRWFDGRGRG
jgi:hypothetical protein